MAETTDELLARMAKKYGLPPRQEQPPAPPPVQPPKPAPAGIISTLKGRAQQLDQQERKALGYSNGGKIRGPGTETSDDIDARVHETDEEIKVSTGERILSAEQDAMLAEMAKKMGFKSLDAMLEAGTGKPVGPTIKAGKRAAATGMGPGNERDTLTPAYRQANEDLARAISQNVLPVTNHALNAAAQDAQERFGRGDYFGAAGRVIRGAAETVGSLPLDANEYGRSAWSSIKPGLSSFASGLAGSQPLSVQNPIAIANQNYGNEGRARAVKAPEPAASAPQVVNPTAQPAPATGAQPAQAMAAEHGGGHGGGTGRPAERSVMDIYKAANDIQNQQIVEQPVRGGIIGNSHAADQRSFDNFLARSSMQSALDRAVKEGGGRAAAAVAGALTGMNDQEDKAAIARDTLAQQGALRSQELGQDARYKGAMVGVQQDDARAKGLLAKISGQEQEDKAKTNALTRDAASFELGQKRSLADMAKEYMNPGTSEERKRALAENLRALQGGKSESNQYEPIYEETTTVDGKSKTLGGRFNRTTGAYEPIGGKLPVPNADQLKALRDNKDNPRAVAAFERYFGSSANYLK